MAKEQEFTQMIRDNQSILYKITSMYTRSRVDQQDLYQDVVYQLWRSYDSFRGDSKRSTWLYRVAMNTAITHLKSGQKQYTGTPIENTILQGADSEDGELESRIKQLYEHVYRLNVLDRGIMLLLLEGKKYEEIAEITGLTATNVGTRISRIKRKLEKTMSHES